jgi:glutamate-ammonia-ligase adenylyltransferase
MPLAISLGVERPEECTGMKLTKPSDLPASLDDRFGRVAERLASINADLPPSLVETAGRVLAVSEFVLGVLERHPTKLVDRVMDPTRLSSDDIASRLSLEGLGEQEAMSALRQFRHCEMARIAWRDIAAWDDLEASLHDLSTLAETMVRESLAYAMRVLEPRYDEASPGEIAPLVVLAMGKLGGRELNFSSDIDLVFLRPDTTNLGESQGNDDQPYYTRLAQLLIKLLDQRTAEGIAFRVDSRLRPFGSSGPLVVSFSAFESYLVSNGRDWERYAYQKARLITGRAFEPEVFDEVLIPFVYRGYLDYGVFDALRQMKRLIRQEVARRELADNIKLGPGGIREIEFIVQAFQLVRGGRDSSLRRRSLRLVLPRLTEERQLGEQEVRALARAYDYLRMLENRLQALEDRQTHKLPAGAEMRARLSYAMRETDWPALIGTLARHRRAVETAFDTVARESEARPQHDPFEAAFRDAWNSGELRASSRIDALGLDPAVLELMSEFRSGALFERMDELSRQRLTDAIVSTAVLLREEEHAVLVIRRLFAVYEAICRRSAYLALLNENATALEHLIALAKRSESLCLQIARQPILLDELLDPRIFDTPPSRREFRELLSRQLENASSRDLESSLDVMRQFHSAAIFRIAIADTLGQLPLMQVSDRLTDTAELVVQFALDLAWSALVERHGRPRCGEPRREAGFAVIAYGKLGGLELGYGSDLDLVFLHDSEGSQQLTDGDKPIDNAVFFARLAQRLLHYLSIQTSAGRLYEVDTRLRPSGNSGLLVASMVNFHQYQRKDAWIWEHQALLRSRAIAGMKRVRDAFERERMDILTNAVDRRRLRDEVVKMRKRMRRELSCSGPSQFDLKQDEGGLADIEFLVDYLVLEHLPETPDLAEYPDNIRQIEALERTRLLAPGDADDLKRCYLALRRRAHDLALDSGGRVVDGAELAEERDAVRRIWRHVLG